jgi:type I restriction enzyme S subunit
MVGGAGERELPPGWADASVKDLVVILDRFRVPINQAERDRRISGKAASDLYPYFGATGQVGLIDGFIFEGEAILLGEDGAPFLEREKCKAYAANGKYWVNNHAHILKSRIPGLNQFLMHQLNHIDYSAYVSGTTRLKLTQAEMIGIPLALPPANEARRISARIDALFGEIEAAKQELDRAREGLAAYRRAVLKAAVTGELTSAWRDAKPAREAGSELLARIIKSRQRAADQRDSHSFSEPEPWPGIDLPTGWAWASIDQVGPLVQYGTSAKCSGDNQGVAVLRMGNIQEGRLDYDSLKFLPHSHGEFPELLLKPGDILFNRTNSAELVGKTAVYDGVVTPCSFASYLIRLRLLDVRPHYLSYFINSVYGRQWITTVVSQQVGQANVNGTKLRHLTFPLPPLAEQDEIIRQAEFALGEAEVLRSEIDRAESQASRLRQAILFIAFAGRLVPQDAADDPAFILLEQLRAQREATPLRRRGREPPLRVTDTSDTPAGPKNSPSSKRSGTTRTCCATRAFRPANTSSRSPAFYS